MLDEQCQGGKDSSYTRQKSPVHAKASSKYSRDPRCSIESSPHAYHSVSFEEIHFRIGAQGKVGLHDKTTCEIAEGKARYSDYEVRCKSCSDICSQTRF